jgi:hypothetical protein
MAGTSCPAGGAPPAQAHTPSLRQRSTSGGGVGNLRMLLWLPAVCFLLCALGSSRVAELQQHEIDGCGALASLLQDPGTGWRSDRGAQAEQQCESLLPSQAPMHLRCSPVAVPAMQLLTALATMRVSWPLVRQ